MKSCDCLCSVSQVAFTCYCMLIVSRQIDLYETVGGLAWHGMRARVSSLSRRRRGHPPLTRTCSRSVTFAVSTTLSHVFSMMQDATQMAVSVTATVSNLATAQLNSKCSRQRLSLWQADMVRYPTHTCILSLIWQALMPDV